MYNEKLKQNGLTGYHDVKKALLDLTEPYMKYLSTGCARIDMGPAGATFNDKAIQLEGFTRLLWGLVPYLAGGNEETEKTGFGEMIIKGITNGCDPDHEEFWGVPGDYDQLLVEMAVFGYALLLIPEVVWEPLSPKAKGNFAAWLSYINKRQIPECNWIFFRILVNCGLKKAGAKEFSREHLESSLGFVEEFYLNDYPNGWYNDGIPEKRRARDYYIPWAMHYYGLIFARLCGDEYPDYAQKYRERAELFSRDFSHWFDREGQGLPYGRSLTYRFAQCGFWGALPFGIDDPHYSWAKAKGFYLRNLRWWFSQPAFTDSGLLSVGYTYPNQYMAERYNSPNSPLWAYKAFIPLALPETHVFWQADEAPPAPESGVYVQESTGFHICHTGDSGHLYVLSAGQWTPGVSNEHLHLGEKYGKFAYSTYFGFNVAIDTYGIDKLAPDSMLLLGDGDDYYRYRKETTDHTVTESYVYSKWKPFPDVEIDTWLFHLGTGRWHLRAHKVQTARKLSSAEGGFPLPFDDSFYPLPGEEARKSVNNSSVTGSLGTSRIVNLGERREGLLVIAAPNSNIIHPRSIVPTLLGEHEPGVFWLFCLVSAHPDPDVPMEVPAVGDVRVILPEEVNINLIKILEKYDEEK